MFHLRKIKVKDKNILVCVCVTSKQIYTDMHIQSHSFCLSHLTGCLFLPSVAVFSSPCDGFRELMANYHSSILLKRLANLHLW